jgi:aryl-alcohol dehydrogenase-like predicted oxidoreductase
MIEMASRYGEVDALQPPYNLIWRFIEEDALPYCRAHDIGIVTYSSLAQGLLTGTLRLNTPLRGDDQRYGNPPYDTRRCRAGFHTRRLGVLEIYDRISGYGPPGSQSSVSSAVWARPNASATDA